MNVNVLDFTSNKTCTCPTQTQAISDREYLSRYSRFFFARANSPAQIEWPADQQWGCKGASYAPTLHGALKPMQSGMCPHPSNLIEFVTRTGILATVKKVLLHRICDCHGLTYHLCKVLRRWAGTRNKGRLSFVNLSHAFQSIMLEHIVPPA